MKKATIIAAFLAAIVSSCLISSVAVADCGKMVIFPYRWRQAPPPPPQQPMMFYQTSGRDSIINVNIVNNYNTPPKLGNKCPTNFTPAYSNPPQTGSNTTTNVYRGGNNYNWGNNYNEENTNSGNVNNRGGNSGSYNSDNSGSVVIDNKDESGDDKDDEFFYGDGTFLETGQRAVIAWNGFDDERGEETLILTTNEQSATGEDIPMLSVLPLPGEPIDIKEAKTEVFNDARKLLYSKFDTSKFDGDAPEWYGFVFDRKIGAHNIFVWRLENIESFKKEVTAYIAMKYNNKAAALIDKKTEQVIGEYFKRGFRYFAFDLTEVKEKPADKVAIAYRFKSRFVYFPLQISQIGGTKTHTTVTLVVISPNLIKPNGIVKVGKGENDAWVTGNQSVVFTKAEVNNLDPELAKVFKSNDNLFAREFVFEGDLNGYNGDFTAIPKK